MAARPQQGDRVQARLSPLIHNAVLFVALVATLTPTLAAAEPTFPEQTWEYADPARTGWSMMRLSDAKKYAQSIGSSAVVIVYDGRIIASWGDPAKKNRDPLGSQELDERALWRRGRQEAD